MEINLTRGENATLKNATEGGVKLERPIIYVYAFMVFSVLLAIVIVSGNLLVVAAFKHNPPLRRRGYTFLISLAFSDFLVGIVSLPLWICIVVLGIGSEGPFHVFFISFDIFSALTSVLHLTVISTERYLAVSRPYKHESLPSRVYTATIVFCWLLPAVLASIFPVQLEFALKKAYVPVICTLGFVIPIAVITWMYIGIFKIAKGLTKRLPKSPARSDDLAGEENKKCPRNFMRAERRTAITLTIITGLFFVAWLPFFATNLTATFCMSCLPREPVQMWLIDFVKWMHYTNSAVNPFVYAFRDAGMRRAFVRLGVMRCAGSGRSACCHGRRKREQCRRTHRSKAPETML